VNHPSVLWRFLQKHPQLLRQPKLRSTSNPITTAATATTALPPQVIDLNQDIDDDSELDVDDYIINPIDSGDTVDDSNETGYVGMDEIFNDFSMLRVCLSFVINVLYRGC